MHPRDLWLLRARDCKVEKIKSLNFHKKMKKKSDFYNILGHNVFKSHSFENFWVLYINHTLGFLLGHSRCLFVLLVSALLVFV